MPAKSKKIWNVPDSLAAGFCSVVRSVIAEYLLRGCVPDGVAAQSFGQS